MAYMCAADSVSGNLMAIAQQLIKQKQEQEQEQEQQQQLFGLHPWNNNNNNTCWITANAFSDPFEPSFQFPPFRFSDFSDDWFASSESHWTTAWASPPSPPPPPPSPTLPTNDTHHHPLLKALIDCAWLSDNEAEDAAASSESLTHLRKYVSHQGNPIQRVAFYFSEALSTKLKSSLQKDKTLGTGSEEEEEHTLCYKTLNDACPYSVIR